MHMRDVFGERVLEPDRGDAYVGGFAGFGEGVVARVEVFAFLGGLAGWGAGEGWGARRGLP